MHTYITSVFNINVYKADSRSVRHGDRHTYIYVFVSFKGVHIAPSALLSTLAERFLCKPKAAGMFY